jgi:hypothetical protein
MNDDVHIYESPISFHMVWKEEGRWYALAVHKRDGEFTSTRPVLAPGRSDGTGGAKAWRSPIYTRLQLTCPMPTLTCAECQQPSFLDYLCSRCRQ